MPCLGQANSHHSRAAAPENSTAQTCRQGGGGAGTPPAPRGLLLNAVLLTRLGRLLAGSIDFLGEGP